MRFATKRSSSGCTVRSFLPTMYQLGFDFHAVPSTFWLNRSASGTPRVAQTSFCSCSGNSPAKMPSLRLAQVIVKKLPSSPVRFGCRRGVVVSAGVAREGVIASRITIDLHIRLVEEWGFVLCLSLLEDNSVLLSKIHQHRRRYFSGFVEVFFRPPAMI